MWRAATALLWVALACFVVVLGATWATAADTAADAGSHLWVPPPKPDRCQAIAGDLVLVDISLSMRNLFPSVRRELEAYVDGIEDCRLVVLSTFGTTADVVTAEFMNGPEARQRLKGKIRELRPSQSDTNFDEAAKLAEWVFAKLTMSYGPGDASFGVKVLSDDVPSPSPGKSPFRLREYLANSFPKARLQVIEVTPQVTGVAGPAATVRSSTGVVIAQVPIEKLRAILGEPGEPAKPASVATAPEPAAPGRDQSTVAPWLAGHRRALVAPAGGLFALVVALMTIRLLRRKSQVPGVPGNRLGTVPETRRAPTDVLVREIEYRKDGAGNGPAAHLLREKRIPVGLGVPLTFGRDRMASWVVASGAVGNHGELFRITCVAGPAFRIRGIRDLRANGQRLSGAEREFDASQPLQVQVGSAEWQITPEFASGRDRTADELFAVPAPADGTGQKE